MLFLDEREFDTIFSKYLIFLLEASLGKESENDWKKSLKQVFILWIIRKAREGGRSHIETKRCSRLQKTCAYSAFSDGTSLVSRFCSKGVLTALVAITEQHTSFWWWESLGSRTLRFLLCSTEQLELGVSLRLLLAVVFPSIWCIWWQSPFHVLI